jgi:hypothetical protein
LIALPLRQSDPHCPLRKDAFMARLIRCAVLGAVTLLLVLPFLTAGPEADPSTFEEILNKALAVQAALREGREHLQHGQYQAAVRSLEREVTRAGGDKDYLAALESAYKGSIRELQQTNPDLANTYAGRLAILDPGSMLEQPKSKTPAVASLAATPAVPAKPGKEPATSPTLRGSFDFNKTPAVTESGGDPFSNANFAAPLDARALVAKADKEFIEKHYQAAGKLYQQAYALDPKVMAAAEAQKCWGYCKMVGVIEAMNQPALSPSTAQELMREVRLAMSLSPTLDSYGETLLKKLQERTTPSAVPAVTERPEPVVNVPMRHCGKQGQWNVLETANFRVLHNQPREVAEKAARIAEQTRAAMSKKWFGENAATWNPPCDLYLHATGQDYSQATGVPSQSPGHSTVKSDGEHVLSRRVDIHCDDPNWPIGVLPHETTHVVLAGRYGDNAVPRWADEGMAVLAEPRDRIERHLRNLPKHRDDGMLFKVGQLMEMENYPDPRYIGPFYAQSVSLVEYLSSLKGSQTYTAFLREGLRSGYEKALQKHFAINGYADLERRWQDYAFRQQSAASE